MRTLDGQSAIQSPDRVSDEVAQLTVTDLSPGLITRELAAHFETTAPLRSAIEAISGSPR